METITAAAGELNQSKDSISYQISKLKNELGFQLFERTNAAIFLTEEGRQLLATTELAINQIDKQIADLRSNKRRTLSVGMLTYFSSRWLSPRLKYFFENHPDISLRIEPLNSIDDLKRSDVDLAILWGIGNWGSVKSERLLDCPSVPTANENIASQVKEQGLLKALQTIPLLGDSSGDAGWRHWHEAANIPYQPSHSSLVIPDSNNRVQVVIDGQGIGLWDRLVEKEFAAGTLIPVSDLWLQSSGYDLLFPKEKLSTAAQDFLSWIRTQA